MTTLLDCALRLASGGVRVYPADKNRLPMIKWSNGASTDPAAVRAMPWHRAWLVKVVTGERLDVLDIDPRHGGDRWLADNRHRLPITREHATAGGGVHLLFRHAPGLRSSQGRVGQGCDVLAEGFSLNWWPSRGLPVANAGVLADWPAWLLAAALPPPAPALPPAGPVRHQDLYARSALRRAADAVSAAPAGQRNHVLNRETWSLARLDVDDAVIWRSMLDAALAAGLDRREAEATIASALRRRRTAA